MELGKGGGTFLKKSFPLPSPKTPSLPLQRLLPVIESLLPWLPVDKKQSDGFRSEARNAGKLPPGFPPRTAPPAIRPVYKYL